MIGNCDNVVNYKLKCNYCEHY